MHSKIMRSALIAGLLVSFNAVGQSEFDLADISLPPGFTIEIWTDDVPNARSMALGVNGTEFVATRRDRRVYAVFPEQASEPSVYTIAEGLEMPTGVAFRDGDLYDAENHQIMKSYCKSATTIHSSVLYRCVDPRSASKERKTVLAVAHYRHG